MNTPTTPETRQEQILELLADHLASNDHVEAVVKAVGEKFPQEAERILKEHRQAIAQASAPKVTLPANPDIPALRRDVAQVVQMWAIIVAGIVVFSAGVLLFFLLRR